MALQKDWKEFLELLNAHGVEYVLVGAFAFAYHAHPRFTGDLDVLVRSSGDNAARVLRVIHEFGFRSLPFAPEDFLTPGRVVQLGHSPIRIDVMNSVDGVSFDEVWAGRVTTQLDGVPVALIGRDELIRNKRAAGREKDLADLRELGA